jgi:Tfp pilus assembly protein PilN
MSDINFVSGGSGHKKHTQRDDVEYSSIASTERVTPKPSTAPVQPAATQPATVPTKPVEQKPKKTHSFFAWRKKRADSTPAPALKTPEAPAHVTPVMQHAPNPIPPVLRTPNVTPTVKPAPAPLFTPGTPPQQPAQQRPQPMPQPVLHEMPKVQAAPTAAPVKGKRHRHADLLDSLPVTEVNLIPDAVLNEFENRNRVRDLGFVALLMVVLVMLTWGGFKIYERKITTDTVAVESDIATLNQQIATFKKTQAAAEDVSGRLDALDQVMQAHVYWTPFLSMLEDLTLPTVYYTTMTGSANGGVFTFDVVAQAYNQIAPQVALFKASPLVSSVTVSSIQLFQPSTVISSTPVDETAAEGVSFKLTVQFTNDAFVHPQLRSYVQN